MIPGGPLPPPRPGMAPTGGPVHRGPDGLPRTRPVGLEPGASPVLSATMALLALLLVAGIVGIVWLLLRPPAQTGPVDPIDGVAIRPVATPAPTARPTPTRADAELPGTASMHDMEIVDADPEEAEDRTAPPLNPPSQLRDAEDRTTPRAEPEPEWTPRIDERPTETAGLAEADDPDGAFVDHERREVEAAAEADLREGMIVGDRPRTREGREIDARPVDERRSAEEQANAAGGTTGRTPQEPTPSEASSAAEEPPPTDLPSLRFLSARVQPMGVPLSLRIRPENFLAQSVSVYYQWRGQGESGRRKRGLRPQSDGSFALDIQASELEADRLQLWFVAEPGPVRAGSPSNPIEVKVR